ncbi:MAG: D-alanyl-D-alanine carboxypeptidase/D-alanyl-D-alanine-endopeptidase [Bacteroidota bacterium]|nr:D-alanyl-D-alanine carboxypeptidase/D-alanyl-D-alanine-endopeptidase [Bacteroidota bacterium]
MCQQSNNFFYIPIIVLLSISGYSQNKKISANIQSAISKFTDENYLKTSSIGISIIDMRNGQLVGQFNSNKSLIPASSQKILSSAAILDVLGKDFRYQTNFYLSGRFLEDSSFYGRLLIKPSGDPSFCSPYQSGAMLYKDLTDSLSTLFLNLGIRSFKGEVIVDESLVTDIPENPEWLWYDLGNYYGAGSFNLNFLENSISVDIKQGLKPGATCEIVKVEPDFLKPYFISRVVSSAENIKEELFVLGTTQEVNRTVHGHIKCCGNDTHTIRASLPNPSATFIRVLKNEWMNHNIQMLDTVVSDSSNFSSILFQYQSVPLEKLCDRALKKSVNMYCESFLHSFGLKMVGNTNRKKSIEALEKYWEKQGLEPNGFKLEDGSGLSPKNSLSSKHLATALYLIVKKIKLKNFHTLLVDPNSQGVLAGYMLKHPNTVGRLQLKSGGMEGVLSYSGYIMFQGQEQFAISLIINHYDGNLVVIRKKIAQFFSELCEIK